MRLLRVAATLVVVLGCSKKPPGGGADDAAVRAVYREYDAALKAGDLEGMKARMSAARVKDLDVPEAAAGVAMAAQMRPKDFVIGECVVGVDRGLLKLQGSGEMGKVDGEVSFVREGGVWKVDKESWTVKMDLGGPSGGPPPPPDVPMSAAVKAIVDRVASEDAMEGSKAWLELGARYQSSGAFLGEARQALRDERPVKFAIVEETFKGGGKTIRYFTSKPAATGSGVQPSGTVGEALRYHFWQWENASGGGFKGGFADWWPTFASSKGLPVR